MQENLKGQLYDVISGKSQVRFGTVIQAIASYLEKGKETSGKIEIGKRIKEQEEKRLRHYIEKYKLWKSDVDFSQYVSEGAEQRVYLGPAEKVRNASDARRQGEAVYEYCEPRATKQMMYFWLTVCFRV